MKNLKEQLLESLSDFRKLKNEECDEVRKIHSSELSGKNNNVYFKPGDTIYRDMINSEYSSRKDEYNVPVRIVKIRKPIRRHSEGKFLIDYYTIGREEVILSDWAQNFKNEIF